MYQDVKAEIVEQPETKSMRFRYLCEGRTAGSLLGVKSTVEEKSYPSIRVTNYDGAAVVLVSCVTIDKKPKPHPNCLIGKSSDRGVCKVDFTTRAAAPTVVRFKNLGIQCAKVSDAEKNLEERQMLRIDPFKTGFGHKLRPKSINFHQIRLCFQVFLKPDLSSTKIPIPPIVSDVIYDKHTTNMKLAIHDFSDDSGPACGGKKIMIFCDKVDKKDISIRFYEEDAKCTVVWEDFAVFSPTNVHKQVGISFTIPKYKVQDIDTPVKVFFRLQTLTSPLAVSNSVPFQYVPNANYVDSQIITKKRKIDDSGPLYDFLQKNGTDNIQKSKMVYNIDPNEEACTQNIAPENYNFLASNFDASNNNLLPTQQSQHYGIFNCQDQREIQAQLQKPTNYPEHHGIFNGQGQQQAQHQQPPNYPPQHYGNFNGESQHEQHIQPQKPSNYQWPSSIQPLQPLQINNTEHHRQKHIENPQFQQSNCYQQQQYQSMEQSKDPMVQSYCYQQQQYQPRMADIERWLKLQDMENFCPDKNNNL